jgi:predicted PurR-regulated permease PerM
MVWEIALVVLLLVLTVLVILLIPTVVQLFKTLQKFNKTLDEINRDLPQIMENLEEITDHTSRATRRIDHAIDDVVEIQQKISDELKEPALDTIATLAGVFKGLQTFVTYFVKKRK